MNLVTKGLGKNSSLVTKGFSELVIEITPIQPSTPSIGGGGYWIEDPPLRHPFELISTKKIIIPQGDDKINVKVTLEEISVEAEFDFIKYDKIKIIIKGMDND